MYGYELVYVCNYCIYNYYYIYNNYYIYVNMQFFSTPLDLGLPYYWETKPISGMSNLQHAVLMCRDRQKAPDMFVKYELPKTGFSLESRWAMTPQAI